MSTCCTPDNPTSPKHFACPECEKLGLYVEQKTVFHHVKNSWELDLNIKTYNFCSNPSCNVVYFRPDNKVIRKEQVRTVIGIKENADEALVCYCFGISKKNAASNKHLKEFVTEQTKNKLCTCVTCNPSGKCCLKDFPK